MTTTEIRIPDIGDASDVSIIEILVSPGDEISKDDSLITLESDKASMEVPSPSDGIIDEIKIAIGDKVSEGDLILMLKTQTSESEPAEQSKQTTEQVTEQPTEPTQPVEATQPVQPKQPELKPPQQTTPPPPAKTPASQKDIYAGPAVRRIAREFGVDLTRIVGTGRKNRILKEDVQTYVKNQLAKEGTGVSVAPPPSYDFSKYGEIDIQPLNKIKRLTGVTMHRNWVTIPHVTQFDEADITELENFRQANKKQVEAEGFKLTPLVFIMRAVVSALKEFPIFNASLDEDGQHVIYKKYCHIGIAVDTPNGLVVPIIRDVDKKSILQLAKELAEMSKKVREKGLALQDMVGGCFTISSLGGIGGTAFNPIINAPEVAILGVSKTKMQPVYQEGEFIPRLMLPFSLSYDHRVIDGAESARFTRFLAAYLSDIRKLLL